MIFPYTAKVVVVEVNTVLVDQLEDLFAALDAGMEFGTIAAEIKIRRKKIQSLNQRKKKLLNLKQSLQLL